MPSEGVAAMEGLVDYILKEVPLWGILTPTAIVLAYWYLTKDFGMFDKYGYTGPKPYPLLGTSASVLTKGILYHDFDLYAKWKSKRIIRTFEFGEPSLVILDPFLAKTILVKEFNHFVNRKLAKSLMEPLDRSLLTIRDDHWRHVRNLVSPTFSAAKLKKMTPLIQKCCDSLLGVLKQKSEDNVSVVATNVLESFTLDVIASTMFALDVDSLNNPDHPFVRKVRAMVRPTGWKFTLFMICFILMPTLTKKMAEKGYIPNRDELNYFVKNMESALEERRKEKGKYHDFVALMTDTEVDESAVNRESSDGMKWTDKGLTKKDIISQMCIFFLAGFETTSSALTFATYEMCLHPDLQKRLQDEVDEVLEGEPADYDNVHRLQYMDMFINETLRLYGPGFRLVREADVDIEIDGLFIPKGVAVNFLTGAYNRDPDVWPEPEKFDPERFSPEEKAKRDPSLFIPFSQGPRNCVGMRLALLEMKMGLAKIIQNCTLTLDEECPTEIRVSKFSMTPETPLKFKVNMR